MKNDMQGWDYGEEWNASRRTSFIKTFILIIIPWIILIIIRMMNNYPSLWILGMILIIPIMFLIGIGMIYYRAKKLHRYPQIRTDRPHDKVLTLIKRVLDSNGVDYVCYTFDEYAKEGSKEQVKKDIKVIPGILVGNIIDLSNGIISILMSDQYTYVKIYPTPLSDNIMTDLENSLIRKEFQTKAS
jgi:hypothetical protein